MNNAIGHPDLSYKGVQIEFFPPNTTALIQPLDQGLICTFNALYTRNMMQHLVKAMDSDEKFSLKEFWHNFAIATGLEVIIRVLQETRNIERMQEEALARMRALSQRLFSRRNSAFGR